MHLLNEGASSNCCVKKNLISEMLNLTPSSSIMEVGRLHEHMLGLTRCWVLPRAQILQREGALPGKEWKLADWGWANASIQDVQLVYTVIPTYIPITGMLRHLHIRLPVFLLTFSFY